MTLARLEAPYPPPARSWVELLEPAAELARTVAATDFVPRNFRNNPAAITAAILYGDEVGLGPLQSLAKIAVIEGRPFMSAEAQRALVLAAGHEMWPDEFTVERVTWCGRRAGGDAVTRVTWSMDDARRAGLHGKPNWRSYPRQMLSARASAELVRAIFADVVGGLAAIEEFDDLEALEVEGEGGGADSVGATRGAKRRRPRKGLAAAGGDKLRGVSPPTAELGVVDLPPLPDEPAAPARDLAAEQAALDADIRAANERLHARQVNEGAVEGNEPADEPVPASRRQKGRLGELYRNRGITERAERARISSSVIGRVINSSTELTEGEADKVIAFLESTPARADEQLEGQQALEVEPDARVTT